LNFFPLKFIARHQGKLLFVVVWLHVTILDLFYVTYSGPIFFWQESFQLYTLAIHLTVALLTLGLYFLLINLFQRFSNNASTKVHSSNANSDSLNFNPLKKNC